MKEDIALHHRLEMELYRLRLLRDLNHPDFRAEREDAILDQMEEVGYRLAPGDREILEAERAVRDAGEPFPEARTREVRTVDVDRDGYLRRCLPLRMPVGVP